MYDFQPKTAEKRYNKGVPSRAANTEGVARSTFMTREQTMPILPEFAIPHALCECGCGRETPITKKNRPDRGLVKGQHQRFIPGHSRHTWPLYAEEDRGYTTPCWIWRGTVNKEGYGTSIRNGRSVKVHRWFYEQECGPVPGGLPLDHLCRQHACMRPDHLEPVTHKENQRRGVKPKLTVQTAAEIKALPHLSHCELGRRYGVTPSCIADLRKGRTWVDVEPAQRWARKELDDGAMHYTFGGMP